MQKYNIMHMNSYQALHSAQCATCALKPHTTITVTCCNVHCDVKYIQLTD